MAKVSMKIEKRASLPIQAPRSWHGMTSSVWFRLLAQNNFSISPSRCPMAISISFVSLANSLMAATSERIYRKRTMATQIEQPPLFVIGHWRTGTTWLHELLVRDHRFTFPTTYQCMAPHHFLLTERWLSGPLNWTMPSKRPMDDMAVGMSRPQEDEFALMNLGLGSPYLEWAFPNRNPRYDQYLSLQGLDAVTKERWKNTFEYFVKQLTFRSPKRVVLKSPTHTVRVATLLKIFPDARFVHVVRNPLQFIPSMVRMWTRMTDAMSLQVRRDPISVDRILEVFRLMYDQFEIDRQLIPTNHFFEVRYEDLVSQPLSQMELIYQHLGLGDFEPARPAISECLASGSGYKPNKLELPNEVADKIYECCAAYMKRHHYPIANEREPASILPSTSSD